MYFPAASFSVNRILSTRLLLHFCRKLLSLKIAGFPDMYFPVLVNGQFFLPDGFHSNFPRPNCLWV